ncbi:MAG: vWA domain-containing protein [candidate division WOR-3 bacterium]
MFYNLLTIIFIIGLGVCYVLLFLKDRKAGDYKAHSFLRLVILLLVILMLLGYVFRLTFTQSPKIPILVLVDISKSMDIKDNITQVNQVVDKINKLPNKKQVFSFGDSVFSVYRYEQPFANRTDITKALSFAKNKKPGCIVLVSDGQHNAENDPMMIVKAIQSPIYTIGIGAEQKSDIAIHSIIKPWQSFFGDTVNIIVRIENNGFYREHTKIRLMRKGKEILNNVVQFSDRDVIQEVSFKVVPETTGKIVYTVKIDSLFNEATYLNNAKEIVIDVIKNRWQIVYLTNAPSFNTRFLPANLTANEDYSAQFTVIPIVAFVNQNFQILKQISLDQALQAADAIILDNIDETKMPSEMSAKLKTQISTGKGVLILTGENFRLTSLSDIMPFEFKKENIIKKDIFLELTDVGAVNPIFYDETNQFLLNNTPPLWGLHPITNLKPSTIIWAVSKEDKNPLIVYYQYQKSKIVAVTGFPIWRWSFSAIETEKTQQNFSRFIKNLMRFLSVKDLTPFRLVTNKSEYLTGEPIFFNLFATSSDGSRWSGLNVELDVPNFKVTIPLYEADAGIYQGESYAFMPGEHFAQAKISKDGKEIGTAKTSFLVTQQSIENITGLNADLLNKLANATGGKYYPADEFLKQTFYPEIVKYKKSLRFAFYNNPYIYVIVTIIFGIVLFLRKKKGFL